MRTAGADQTGEFVFRVSLVERAERDEGSRRRPADPRPAVNEQRALLIPCLNEGDEFGHMLDARRHEIVDFLGNVVHAEAQMLHGQDALRRVDHRVRIEQAHEMGGLYLPDRIRNGTEGAYINHHFFWRALVTGAQSVVCVSESTIRS